MAKTPVDPTDAGYDDATALNDGNDTIPTGVTEAEAGLTASHHGAEGAGVATEDDTLDDVHDADEMAAATRVSAAPDNDADANTTDNTARWSEDPAAT